MQSKNSAVSHSALEEENTAPVMPLLASGRKKRWSYWSLFFSLFFFVPLIVSSPLSVELWLLQIAGYLCFVTLYIKAINQQAKALPPYLLLMFLLSVACSFQNPGGATIIGFIAFIVGYYNPIKTGLSVIGAIILILVSLHLTMFDNASFLLGASLSNSVILFGFGVMERKETLHLLKEAKHAESMSMLSAIAERERIGRDLHDVAGHALSSIALKAQLADKLLSKKQIDLAQQEVRALAQLSQALLSDIRHAVSNIKHLSLQEEITKNIALLEENQFNVKAELSDSVDTLLTSVQETQLALILKELTTNTLRHSRGRNVSLQITHDTTFVVLHYCDFGERYSADKLSSGYVNKETITKKLTEGNGLTGIRERARSINASVQFQCISNAAFSCKVSLPLA